MNKETVYYCMECGKIKRVGVNYWESPTLTISSYVLSHGYCDKCRVIVLGRYKAEFAAHIATD